MKKNTIAIFMVLTAGTWGKLKTKAVTHQMALATKREIIGLHSYNWVSDGLRMRVIKMENKIGTIYNKHLLEKYFIEKAPFRKGITQIGTFYKISVNFIKLELTP